MDSENFQKARVFYRWQLVLFFGAVMFMNSGLGIHESVFNNYLSDTFGLSADTRGWLEFPRELPGFLVVLMTGVLAALPVTRLGVIGALVFAVGMVGYVTVGGRFYPMVGVMVLASAGLHLLMPVSAGVTLALAKKNERGKRMGQLGAIRNIGLLLGSGFVWLVFEKDNPSYRMGFMVAGGAAIISAVIYSFLHIRKLHRPRPRMVFHKKYKVYYWLEFLFGARKQIFITFGPWVLIQVYKQPASSIAALFLIAAILGIFIKPLAGMAVDRFGERNVMILDGLLLGAVCLGYGFALRWAPDMESARYVACGCFVLDNLLFALGNARAVYVSRLARGHAEITSTLSLGVSINHIASMTIPAVAGYLWIAWGYETVFLAAAVLAIIISISSGFVPVKANNS
jgi:MFS family permease